MRILVYNQHRALGDGVFFIGYYKALKEKYKDIEIDVFCTPMHANALKNNPYISNIFYFLNYYKPWKTVRQEKIIYNVFLQKYFGDLRAAAKNKYDYILDIDSHYKKPNLEMLEYLKEKTSAKLVAKTNPKSAKLKNKNLFDEFTSGYPFEALGINEIPVPELYVSDEYNKKAADYFNNYKKDGTYNIIINGEGSGLKSLPADEIINITNAILSQYNNINIFFMGYNGAGVIEKYTNIINATDKNRVFLTYKTNVEDSFALINNADLVISVDTAVIHIATALNTKFIEICGYATKNYIPVIPIDAADKNLYRISYKDKLTNKVIIDDLLKQLKDILNL